MVEQGTTGQGQWRIVMNNLGIVMEMGTTLGKQDTMGGRTEDHGMVQVVEGIVNSINSDETGGHFDRRVKKCDLKVLHCNWTVVDCYITEEHSDKIGKYFEGTVDFCG